MAEQAKVRIDIGSKADLKGFKQVETASQKLGKSVKKLGVAFGAAFTVAGAKNAVRAFAADDKAAKALSRTLNNLGLAFADPAVKTFIADLEKQFGVLDDQLRPAFQKLLTTTGDVTKSQDLLKTALDLSAMSGVDVVTVSGDLSRAFTGNTRVLGKYSLGINKADLATMSFDEILTRVAKVSSGQAQAAADTLAGSIAKLQVATANASESIGKDLVTALTTLGGQGGLPKTLSLIESLASTIGDAIIGFSRLIQLVVIFGSGNPLESLKDAAKFNEANRLADLAEIAATKTNFKSYAAKKASDKLALAASNAITKNTKTQAAAELAKAKAKKDQAALDKAALALAKGADVFDLDKIQINAALLANQQALNKLSGAGTEQQRLGLANDLVRLTIKQDMLLLEDAIAAKDVNKATALAAQLNKNIGILSVMQGQNLTLLQINSILEAFKPKDLINLANLNEALRLLMAMALIKITPYSPQNPKFNPGQNSPPGFDPGKNYNPEQNKDRNFDDANKDYFAALAAASAAELAKEGGNRAGLGLGSNFIPAGFASLDEYAKESFGNRGTAAGAMAPVINISAGVIAQMDEFTAMVQRAVQAANRNGNNLDVAGVI